MSAVTASAPRAAPPDPPIADGRRVSRTFGYVVVLTAVITSVGSFLILTGQTAIEPTPIVVRAAVIINGLIVAAADRDRRLRGVAASGSRAGGAVRRRGCMCGSFSSFPSSRRCLRS